MATFGPRVRPTLPSDDGSGIGSGEALVGPVGVCGEFQARVDVQSVSCIFASF